jgi:ribosomal protein L29
MKSKDKKELHRKDIKELRNLVTQLRDELAGLRMDKTQNKLKNTSMLFIKRKEVAQMLTIMRAKELADIEAKKKA